MRDIEINILNPNAVQDAEKMMVCTARLTQKGHTIKNLADFMALYEKGGNDKIKETMVSLPHPTIQKFSVIDVVIIGASRRFLAQITRHQNEVKFMSASLQYSDYSGVSDFVVPYEFLDKPEIESTYLDSCKKAMDIYMSIVESGCSNDSAGYMAPQGLKNILIMSATPYQWKHMIGQRTCRRNTAETRYVMLRIWEQLYSKSEVLFSSKTSGMFCMRDKCMEGNMSCGLIVEKGLTPTEILKKDFPLLMK